MNVSDLKSEIRFLTRTDTETFSDADILDGLNLHNGEYLIKVLLTTGDWNLNGKKCTTELLSTTTLNDGDSGYDGHYSFPANLLRPVRMEVSYDGESYNQATVYDINDFDNVSEQNEQDSFSQSEPHVRFYNNEFVIRPLPSTDVTDGIIIWYEKRQEELVDDSDIPEIELNFHHILAYAGALRYAERRPEKYNPNWEKRLYGLEKDMMRYYANKFYRNKSLKVVVDNYK